MKQSRCSVYAVLICAVCLAGILPLGCPSPEGKSSVTVLLAGDAGLTAAKTQLDMESVVSLTVTVTEITLDYCPTGEGEGEGEGEQIVLFTGAKDVELRDLSGISEVISTAELPAGSYCTIRLSIENPRLILADAPETVLENVQLTANGRLFVSGGFELAEDVNSLVLLDFESFHLVQAGNSGQYVLTPQLRATIQVLSAEAQATGVIAAVDVDTSMLTLDVDDSDATIDVNFATAQILLADLTPGTVADLTVGANIQVAGTLSVSGVLTADTITLIAP
ncbi:MAG: DUF4382 domain-containing protein [Candidatus Hydrogenedentes bacterium]|nr:DUF4382 domain-containing protein [Candidatus Hydrogenedentota bacterium]